MLGVCNGFQTLVKAGLLPGWEGQQKAKVAGEPVGAQPATRTVTLTDNASGHFECRWVHLAVEPQTQAGFLTEIDGLVFCPVAHGEGNVQVAGEATVQQLEENGLVALRYVDASGNRAGGRHPLNPNGSVADIAGICNERGNVVGLMPHPEDHVLPIQNPLGGKGQLGLALFKAVIHG